MISRYAELTATLGLLPALLIEGEAPADAPRDVIAAAFEEALTALRLSPASVLSPAQQRSVAIRAVSRLMQQNAHREALRASLMGKPEVAGLQRWWKCACWRF